MLACYFQNRIPGRLLVHKHQKIRTKFLDIPGIVQKGGVELCDHLLGLHAFPAVTLPALSQGKARKVPLSSV